MSGERYSRFFQAGAVKRMHQYGPRSSGANPRFHFHKFLAGAPIAQAVIYIRELPLICLCFSPWSIPQLQVDWTLYSDHGQQQIQQHCWSMRAVVAGGGEGGCT